MSYKRYVDWSIALVVGIAIGALFAGPAHAAPVFEDNGTVCRPL
jgi:hypothetical protein